METGGTQRQHLERLAANPMATEKSRAFAREQLAAHPCPPVFQWLYLTFGKIASWRGSTGMGPAPLTLHDIAAYEARFGIRLQPGELVLVKRLDAQALAA